MCKMNSDFRGLLFILAKAVYYISCNVHYYIIKIISIWDILAWNINKDFLAETPSFYINMTKMYLWYYIMKGKTFDLLVLSNV